MVMDSRYKYIVVGSKQLKKMGRELSKHRKLGNAKASAKKFANKGYQGMIYARKAVKPRSKVHSYYPEGYGHRHTWGSEIAFDPKKGVHNTNPRRRKGKR